jgi:hypothetical protein
MLKVHHADKPQPQKASTRANRANGEDKARKAHFGFASSVGSVFSGLKIFCFWGTDFIL